MKKMTILGIACVDIMVFGYKEMPELGRLEMTDEMKLYTGGCALNCAIDLSKIGIDHRLIIPVGRDVFGDFIRDSIKKYQIDDSNVLVLDSASTSSSVVLLDKSGERSFLHHQGANAALDLSDIDIDMIKSSDVLFIAGALLMANFDGKQMAELLRIAKDSGVYTVLDIGWDSTGRWLEILAPVLPHIDLFIPSIDEAEKLADSYDLPYIFDFFKSQGVKQTVIKLGELGAAYLEDGEVKIIPPVRLEKIVDATGAGDSFVSGILTGIYKGWDMKDTIQFANVVGSTCVMSFGASNGVKTFDELLEIKEAYYG